MYTNVDGNIFYNSALTKQIQITSGTLTLTNSDLYAESFELSQNLCSSDSLVFSAEASQCRFRVRFNVPTLKNKYIEVKMIADGKTIPLGKFIVEEDKPNGSRNYRDIVAYDILYYLNNMNFASWYKGLTFPMTINNFYLSLVTECIYKLGISFSYASAVPRNGSHTFNAPYDANEISELSGAKLFTDLATATASFIQINRLGFLVFTTLSLDENLYPAVVLYPSTELLPKSDSAKQRLNNQHYINCYHEDFGTKKIGKIQIIKADGDVIATSGTGTNLYKVIGNMFFANSSDAQTSCDTIFNTIKDVTYTPCNLLVAGNPCLDVGDLIAFEGHGTSYLTYILQRTLKGVQSLKDTYVADGIEEITESDTSLNGQVSELSGKVNKIEADYVKTSTLETDYLRADTAELTYATIDNLDAVSIRVGNVESDYITSTKLDAHEINADKITSGTLSAARIDSEILRTSDLRSTIAELDGVRVNYLEVYNDEIRMELPDGHTVSLYLQKGIVDGKERYYIGSN